MPSELAYFDSCVFIELLQKSDQHRLEACETLQDKAIKGDIRIATSAVTITEVNRIDGSPEIPDEQSQQILDFFENPYIAIRPVDRAVAERAHHLTRTHGLTNLDAIHVATAILLKAAVIYTYDNPKKKRKGLVQYNLKLGAPLIRIELPPDPFAGSLFAKKDAAKAQ